MSGSGGAASGRKGTRYEQELVRSLHGAGYGAMRAPASGGATDRDLPDVIAGKPAFGHGKAWNPYAPPEDMVPNAQAHGPVSESWAIEHKSGEATTLYVEEQEVEDLVAVSERWGWRPLLGLRSTRRDMPTTHYLVDPADARRTDGGNYGLPIADIAERASVAVRPDDEDPEVEVL